MKKLFFSFTILLLISCRFIVAQNAPSPVTVSSGHFPVGERLTYNISFASFKSAAFAETWVISAGKYGTRDAVYLQGKLKTNDLVNAAFFALDETRQTLVVSDTGLPILYKKIADENGFTKEKVTDLKGNATAYDWLSVLYQLRFSDLTGGSLNIQEDGQTFQAVYKQVGKAHSKTPAGEFDTIVIEVQNAAYPALRIHITDDSRRLPVVFTFKLPKGTVRAELAGIQDLSPEPIAENITKPVTTPTPVVTITPKPRATPTPYKNNQPLADDLPFALGETLTYKLTRPGAGNPFGTMVVQAKERRQFSDRFEAAGGEKRDYLLLSLTVPEVTDTNTFFIAGDSIRSYVDPESLLPKHTEVVFRGGFSQFNQTLNFDQARGKVGDGKSTIDIPVGTHDILSLAFAVRSFNFRDKPSKGPSPDTRVALFTTDGPVILTILPQPEETIDFQGKKIQVQVVYTNVGQTTVKLWLSKDPDRLPLRLSMSGPLFSFNADLVSVTQNPPPPDDTPGAVPGNPTSRSPMAPMVVNPQTASDIKKPY